MKAINYLGIIATKVSQSYFTEGLLLTCSFDYLTDTWTNQAFTAFFFSGCYLVPMLFITYFYSQIVVAVIVHERTLRAQAKKMNVESLRSNEVSVVATLSTTASSTSPPLPLQEKSGGSAEVKIAKVAVTNVFIWLLAWTPYAVVALMGQFGGAFLVTPLASQLPSVLAKTASCFNPLVYAVSHPK